MANKLTDKDLCVALSDLFIDDEINYKFVAKTAIHFELAHVEDILLDRVAPVLWPTFFAVVFEWAGYEPDWLWGEVLKVLENDEKPNLLKKVKLKIRRKFMTYMLEDEWKELVKEYNRQKSNCQ